MYDYKALFVLLQLLAIGVAATTWATRTYWPDMPLEALGAVFFGGFMCGGFATAGYLLLRYRRNFAIGDVQK